MRIDVGGGGGGEDAPPNGLPKDPPSCEPGLAGWLGGCGVMIVSLVLLGGLFGWRSVLLLLQQ